jgi:D-tyrosyl-tRNA(Tyr) deacylase
MIALLQRVTGASVTVGGETVGCIGPGVLALIGVQRGDTEAQAARLLERILGYRIFEDDQGRMNLSLQEVAGGLLLVPQFTLAADTRKGMRASFTPAADPGTGESLFESLLSRARSSHGPVASGRFGAHMQVSLVNDGPVTFWLEVPPPV